MIIEEESPAIDWAALGKAFADAELQLDAQSMLASTCEEELEEVEDPPEPEGTSSDRRHWLRPVENIREFFENEAKDFTPWISQNLHQVREAARVANEIHLVGTERRLAGYRIDILAKTRVGRENRYVVIENQLEKSDADHMGRLITCANQARASHAIWIAPEFRDEHIRVMESMKSSMGCEFIPLVVDAAHATETSANIEFRRPPTFRTPEDPMRETLYSHRDAMRKAYLDVSRFNGIRVTSPRADLRRYRDAVEEIGYWAYRLDKHVDEILPKVAPM